MKDTETFVRKPAISIIMPNMSNLSRLNVDDFITIGLDFFKKIQFYTLYNRCVKSIDINRLKAKEWKNIHRLNQNHKRNRVSTPTLDKMDFKTRTYTKGRDVL